MSVRQHKYQLDEADMPTSWYNIIPDLPAPPRRRCTPVPTSLSGRTI